MKCGPRQLSYLDAVGGIEALWVWVAPYINVLLPVEREYKVYSCRAVSDPWRFSQERSRLA